MGMGVAVDKIKLIYDFVSWVNEEWKQGESDIAVMKESTPSIMGNSQFRAISRLDTLYLAEKYLQQLREMEEANEQD